MIRGMTAPSFMDLALKTAKNAGKAGEVPIGCVIVRGYEVIATAGQPHPDRPRSDRACRNLALRQAAEPSAPSGWSIATSMSRWSRARCAPARSRWRGNPAACYYGAAAAKGGAVDVRRCVFFRRRPPSRAGGGMGAGGGRDRGGDAAEGFFSQGGCCPPPRAGCGGEACLALSASGGGGRIGISERSGEGFFFTNYRQTVTT
jgi:tRNA(adenine34) deaminase